MAWEWGKWKQREKEEAALRRECRDLKYVAAFVAFNTWSDQELLTFAKRTQTARTALGAVIHAHDDRPQRLLVCGAGLAVAATGLIGFQIAVTWATIGFLGGAALSANELKGIAETNSALLGDAELARVLKDFQDALIAEAKARGI